MSGPTTLAQAIQQATAQLASGPHPERARPDAELLLRHHLRCDRAFLIAHAHDRLTGAEAFSALIQRRLTGEPVQYITGETEFYGLPFAVSPAVLIPRPETEHLVELVIGLAGGLESPTILDIGTGSGCIAIALAHHLPQAKLVAIDISTAALAIARHNAQINQVDGRIRFLEGDLIAPVTGQSFDFVVSNPPYIPVNERDSLAIEVRDHEPSLALFSGSDGLDLYRRLIPAAPAALSPGGLLALEIGHGQQQPVRSLLSEAGLRQIRFLDDLQHIPRVALATRPID